MLKNYKAEIDEASDRAEMFAKLATEHSDCSSHSNGGDLGWFGPGQMQEAFERAAYALDIGSVQRYHQHRQWCPSYFPYRMMRIGGMILW